MNELEKARENINEIDKKIADLFEKRMDAVKCVAVYKKENGLPIFDESREDEVLSRNVALLKNPDYSLYFKQFLQMQMDISKSFQNNLIADESTITMNLRDKSYNIIVKIGALQNIGDYFNLKRKVLIVTDSGVPIDYAKTVAKFCDYHILEVLPQGENTKSLENMKKLCKIMLENGFTRGDCVVAVGGGVIGDLSGFAASSFMRGIDFYNVPTTLLSQVDSSIGGKVAVNLDSVKNIVGAFYQPKCVVIDASVLKTLPQRQFSNGLAEVIKMSLTSDKDLFEFLEKEDINSNIDKIIFKSLLIKKQIVELDEKEKHLRKVLNFGHTIGHAIESENFGKLYHGECVALGMLPMCSENVRTRLLELLMKVNLPTDIKCDTAQILKHLSHDKKATENGITAVLVDEIGSFRFENLKTEDFKKFLQVKLWNTVL